METPWDWITVMLFAGLITLFLHRSAQEPPPDKLWQYAPPAVACAIANYLGNNGLGIVAGAVLALAGFYMFRVLNVRPGPGSGR
jgi:hypothetical protein